MKAYLLAGVNAQSLFDSWLHNYTNSLNYFLNIPRIWIYYWKIPELLHILPS